MRRRNDSGDTERPQEVTAALSDLRIQLYRQACARGGLGVAKPAASRLWRHRMPWTEEEDRALRDGARDLPGRTFAACLIRAFRLKKREWQS